MTDKDKHVLVCMFICILAGPWWALGAAVGKELLDDAVKCRLMKPFWFVRGTGWDWYDLLAGGVGIAFGMGFRLLINQYIGG